MTLDLKDIIKHLSESHSPSGYEAPIRSTLSEIWQPYVDEFQTVGIGSLVGIRHGDGQEPRPKIMLCAHMDEIGMIVTEVRGGYLRVNSLAGMDARILQAKSVIVHGQRDLIGTVAAVPPHISNTTGDGKQHYPTFHQQWIDLGLPADAVAELVHVGDIVTLDAPFRELRGDVLSGKSFDNRVSLAAVTFCLDLLTRRRHSWDVLAVASTQEEITSVGARTVSQALRPDLAIVLDVGFATQPGVSGDGAFDLGKGPMIALGPNLHPGLSKQLQDTAKECDIPLHVEILAGNTSTDAWEVQVAREGIPTVLVEIPIRNMHSGVESVHLRDVKRLGRLLAEFITLLDGETLDEIAWKRDSSPQNGEED